MSVPLVSQLTSTRMPSPVAVTVVVQVFVCPSSSVTVRRTV